MDAVGLGFGFGLGLALGLALALALALGLGLGLGLVDAVGLVIPMFQSQRDIQVAGLEP